MKRKNRTSKFSGFGSEISKKASKPFSMLREPPKATIIIPIFIYLLVSFFVAVLANSKSTIKIMQHELPISSVTGVLSSIANICIILMVVLYKRRGFIASMVLLAAQLPMLLMSLIIRHSIASIPGIFTNILACITIIIIYINNLKISKKQESLERLFEQTATSLVNAIDAKDTYTHGHSSRVAEYSLKIARLIGKSESECSEIYYAALLHDVGKIGVAENIINKQGKLTPDEFEIIKQHPSMGAQILQSIKEYPFLSIGAHYHHERYDGTGYPDRLKGKEIPEIARIVSIADAYDAMTSKRSYRDPIPQQKVREEFVKGIGTQFDPNLARLMIHLIDLDTEYEMKEREEVKELSDNEELVVGEYRSAVSESVLLSQTMTSVHIKVSCGVNSVPSLILFDSLDGRVHSDEKNIKDMLYFEYGEIWFDGRTECRGARKMAVNMLRRSAADIREASEYTIEAVRIRDHVLVRIIGGGQTSEVITALPDSTRYCYIGITGDHCRIIDFDVAKSEASVSDDYIPRIAEEISYIDGSEGDIPSVQIDGYRSAATEGIEISDRLKLTFRAKSLPTARFVWHCPYIDLFTSDDCKVNGINYHDLAFVRLDGECWACDSSCASDLNVKMSDSFEGWELWKKTLRDGIECTVTFKVEGRNIIVITENAGICIRNTIRLNDVEGTVCAAVTGDQCVVTDIRIEKQSRKS